VRRKLDKELENQGLSYLHKKLKRVDPEAASGIHKNDRMRILRALEVYYGTGTPISVLRKSCTVPVLPLNPLFIVLVKDRELLYRDIRTRVDLMLDQGLIEEVEKIRQMGYDFSFKSLSSLGYLEINSALENRISMKSAIENLKQNTCRYAKRQITWFRKDKNATWFTVNTRTEFLDAQNAIITLWNKFNDQNG